MNKKLIALALALLLALTGAMAAFADGAETESLAEPEQVETQADIEEQAEEEIEVEIEEEEAEEEIEEEAAEDEQEEEAAEEEEQPAKEPETETATEGAISTSDELEAEIASREVILTTTLSDRVTEGEKFEMMAALVGFDHADIELQWQYNAGKGWEDVEGATGESIELEANEQTLTSDWRLQVTVVA